MQNHTGDNTWNNKTKAVYWWIKNRGQLHLAEEMQLLHLSRLLGMKLSWAWAALWLAGWLTGASPGQLLTDGDISCNPGTISSSAVKISPCEATEAYYYTILEANLIWSNKLISLTICKRDLQGQCQENESQYQSLSHLFHTHSLPLSSTIFFSPTILNCISGYNKNGLKKWVNKRKATGISKAHYKLLQKRLNFHYYFNFMQRICIVKFCAQCILQITDQLLQWCAHS